MLQAHAPGKNGSVIFLGFVPSDLDHLVANKPLALDPQRIGLPDRPTVILYETDPMVDFYTSALGACVILFRQNTLDTLRAGQGIQLPVNGPDVAPNTLLFMFHAQNDEGLLAVMRQAGLVNERTPISTDF
jgi:hypothetical protein